MSLLLAALPEFLADLAAAVTIATATWITRKARTRKTNNPNHLT